MLSEAGTPGWSRTSALRDDLNEAIDYYPRFRRVRRLVESHLSSSSIKLSDAANIAGLEPKYFSRLWKSKTGITFSGWLTDVRIDRAIELLKKEDMSILDLALTVGYSNDRTFRRVFKKRVGISPSVFRQILQKDLIRSTSSKQVGKLVGYDRKELNPLSRRRTIGGRSDSRAVSRRRILPGIIVLMIAGGCSGSPLDLDDPIPPNPAPVYGLCDQHPNYSAEVTLNRWPSFPLSFYFDDASFPAEFLNDYRPETITGISSWDQQTADDLGAVVEVQSPGEADFTIAYSALLPANALARTFHSTGTPFLAGGEIVFNRTAMQEGEELVLAGTLSREGFRRAIRGTAAHEMGHLLGIIGHPRWRDVLMGPVFYDTPTSADINTLAQAYCR